MEDTLDIPSLDEQIDFLEVKLLENEIECEVIHQFTPGLYSREIGMPAGIFVVSKVHKTEHQYCVLRGSAYVKVNEGEWVFIQAPFVGVTQPGTRRLLYITENCSWITFHPTDKKTVEEVEGDIIETRVNSVLGMTVKDYNIAKTLNKKVCLGV